MVIVDDLNRPTPASRILPYLLKYFHEAGVPPGDVRILFATGTHAPANAAAIRKKIGEDAAARCSVLVHGPGARLITIGKTSFGTPITVNREVTTSDFIVGIGGVYPNHTAGVGGGSKLALGVLGAASIERLHLRHGARGWGAAAQPSSFRQDLDQIARAIGLTCMISVFVDADRAPVDMICGDPLVYYPRAESLARRLYSAPLPDSADVVIANAYPNDASLTFACMKGFAVLSRCRPAASRIGIASCIEGLGYHGLFPLNRSRLRVMRQLIRRVSTTPPKELPSKLWARIHRKLSDGGNVERQSVRQNPIWVYPTSRPSQLLASPGLVIRPVWSDIIAGVQREQAGKEHLNVALYPCGSLQMFWARGEGETRHAAEAVTTGLI